MLDSDLTKFENQFHKNMHDYMDLINHYEDFAESQKIPKKTGVLAQLRDLDQVKN